MSASDDRALSDVTNKVANVQVDEALLHRVKEAKWATPQGFDYAKYNAGPSESDQPQGDHSNWAANAAKYEWKDDYGDIGPEHEVLEKMLFGDEHKVQQGDEFSK